MDTQVEGDYVARDLSICGIFKMRRAVSKSRIVQIYDPNLALTLTSTLVAVCNCLIRRKLLAGYHNL